MCRLQSVGLMKCRSCEDGTARRNYCGSTGAGTARNASLKPLSGRQRGPPGTATGPPTRHGNFNPFKLLPSTEPVHRTAPPPRTPIAPAVTTAVATALPTTLTASAIDVSVIASVAAPTAISTSGRCHHHYLHHFTASAFTVPAIAFPAVLRTLEPHKLSARAASRFRARDREPRGLSDEIHSCFGHGPRAPSHPKSLSWSLVPIPDAQRSDDEVS